MIAAEPEQDASNGDSPEALPSAPPKTESGPAPAPADATEPRRRAPAGDARLQPRLSSVTGPLSPQFDMSYRNRQLAFGPPWPDRFPALVYLATALSSVAFVAVGENSGSGSWLFDYVVVRDAGRVVTARGFAVLLVCGAAASLLQSTMRGVRLRADGVEVRDLRYGFIPRAQRLRWAQISMVALDQELISLDLWDGRQVRLPVVGDRAGLGRALEVAATAHGITVQGGSGLDDIPECEGDPDDPA